MKILHPDSAALKVALLEKVRLFPRWGYRKMTHVLKNESWQVNHKRVHRLWTELGLRANHAIRRDPVPGDAANACHVRRAERRNHVWTTVAFCWSLPMIRASAS